MTIRPRLTRTVALAVAVRTAFTVATPALLPAQGGQQAVVSGGVAEPARLSVRGEVLVRFGGLRDDPREELQGDADVLDVQRLPGRRWLVTDRHVLKVHSASGVLQRVVGRRGSGPGEFRHLLAVCLLADGRWQALDRQLRRVVRFSADGQHESTRTIESAIEFDGCFADGSLLVRDPPLALYAALDRGESGDDREFRTRFRRVSIDGRSLAMFDSLPFETFAVLRRRVNAVVRRDTFYFAESSTPEVRVYAPDGRLARRISWKAEARPVTEALLRAAGAGRPDRMAQGDQIRATPVDLSKEPRLLPSLGHLRVGSDGTVWVSTYPVGAEPVTWRVFGPDGAVLGRFDVPTIPGLRDVELVRGERDLVVLRALDDDRAVHLLVYSLLAR